MKLKDVSKFFDRTSMWDAYTGRKLKAKCQVTPWDSPRRDGLTTIRRAISLSSSQQLPKRHAIYMGKQTWIVSRLRNPDTFDDDVARVGYVAQLAQLGSIGDVDDILGGMPLEVYLSRVWIKDVKDISSTSEAQGQYFIYFTEGEPLREREFVFVDGRWHIIRNILTGAGGLKVAEVNELEEDCITLVKATINGSFDPVYEKYSGSDILEFKALLMTWKDDYKHNLPSHDKEEQGDIRLRIRLKDYNKLNGVSKITFKGHLWEITDREELLTGANLVIRKIS